VQAAYGTGPLDGGGTVLDGSMLRDLTLTLALALALTLTLTLGA